jgi:hypothetical protein
VGITPIVMAWSIKSATKKRKSLLASGMLLKSAKIVKSDPAVSSTMTSTVLAAVFEDTLPSGRSQVSAQTLFCLPSALVSCSSSFSMSSSSVDPGPFILLVSTSPPFICHSMSLLNAPSGRELNSS